jgi:hypothetical protein
MARANIVRVEEILLGDQPPGILDEDAKRVEHLETQRDHVTPAREAALANVELTRPEPIRVRARDVDHESHLRKVSGILQRSQRTLPTVRF